MLDRLRTINTYLGDFDNIIGVLGLIVGILGIIVGGIGVKTLRDSNKLKIKKSNIDNSQVANVINNSGIGVQDAEHIAERIAKDKVKDIPVIRSGYGPPPDDLGKDGDIYFQIMDD